MQDVPMPIGPICEHIRDEGMLGTDSARYV
jgi:hypothetical protein